MTVIQVAFPVLRGRRRFHVEKGRRWSVVEHLMLDAVARRPASTAELSIKSNLPRRVVVEAFIRLMRVGWVEITTGADGPIFDVTPAGRAQVDQLELRAATVIQPRWMGFVVDKVAGSIFRGRGEIAVRHTNDLSKASGVDALVFLNESKEHAREDLAALFVAREGEDEIIIGVDPSHEKPVERYGVVTITDGVVEGLPARAARGLQEAVLAKAAEASERIKGSTSPSPAIPSAAKSKASRSQPRRSLFKRTSSLMDTITKRL
jgi:cardiolipin synthase A/B